MSAIDGYIVRATLLAFLLIVVSLTGVIWITQALRGIDLMTGQGQSIWSFSASQDWLFRCSRWLLRQSRC
jgi:lipopolysaccharide export system permease protein